jgi:cytochrome c biogenesis protein CcmG/thiol:disulfide interchange protein DsbE
MIEAFNFGPLLIPTRPLILVLSLFFAIWLATRLARRFDLEKSQVKRVAEYIAWIGVLGARLGFVAVNWSAYRAAPWTALYFWQPGYLYLGGLVFGGCGTLVLGQKYFPAKRKTLFTVLGSSYLVAILLYFSGLQSLELLRQPGVSGAGSLVSDIKLRNLSGASVKLSDLAGRGIVLNFWATWCPPCRREMPLLDDIQKIYQARGLSVVGVAIDEPASQVKSYVESVAVSYPIWVDASLPAPGFDRTQNIFSRFGGVGLPTTIFIDRNGVIQKVYVGELSRGFLQSQIDKILDL